MAFIRKGTFDAGIWNSIEHDYPTLPTTFLPGDVVLDVGCHTGAVCELAARRGATVIAFEANRENFALATINLRDRPSVTVRHAAVWRSDVTGPLRLMFTPHADTANTGGGSVLFATAEDHRAARPPEWDEPAPPEVALAAHEADAVGLDDVLVEIGTVRFLKLDVEGAEFPILLTANRLDRVAAVGGEYHELSDDAMAVLAPGARVGDERYSAELLRQRLLETGFHNVTVVPTVAGRGYFRAERSR